MTDDEIYESRSYKRRGWGLIFGMLSGCMATIAIDIFKDREFLSILAFLSSIILFLRGRYLVTSDMFPEVEEECDGD